MRSLLTGLLILSSIALAAGFLGRFHGLGDSFAVGPLVASLTGFLGVT